MAQQNGSFIGGKVVVKIVDVHCGHEVKEEEENGRCHGQSVVVSWSRVRS